MNLAERLRRGTRLRKLQESWEKPPRAYLDGKLGVVPTRWDNPLLLFLFVGADLLFVVMFGLYGLHVVEDAGFWLTQDRSYAESYQYLKQFWLVLLFAQLAVSQRGILYGMLSGVFCYLLLDDYLMIHEHYGQVLADALQLPDAFRLDSSDFGELVLFSIYGMIFVPAFAYSYWVSSKTIRRHAWMLFGYLMAFAFFAVVVDVIHSLQLPFLVRNAVGAVEEGGEMIVISCMLWYVYSVAYQTLNPPPNAQDSDSAS